MTSNAPRRSTRFARPARDLTVTSCLALLLACGSPAAKDSGGGVTDTVGDTGAWKLDAKDTLQDTAPPKDGDLTDLSTGSDSSGSDGDGVASPDDFVADLVDTNAPDQVGVDGSGGCDFPASPAPGEPGSPCKSADECDNGFCVDAPNGKICTAACVSCCPAGFSCGKMTGVDGAFACMPKQLALCQPCNLDADCGKVDPGALCLSYGTAGAFCGAGCATTSDCPSGYACEDSEGQLGAAKQCVRKQDQCSCTKWGELVGATTNCAVQNDLGTCKGTRKCGLAGLTACSAPTPATETCNGADDNCDGVTDPANSVGCVTYYPDSDGDGYGGGKGSCLCADPGNDVTQGGDCNDQNAAIHPGAKEICDGLDNNCNGQTDEGFPDTNGDGFADCVDPDIDGDGVPNALDCAPANPKIYPGAKEICDGLDNDCNGITDDPGAEGCTPWYADGDGDGFGAGNSKCLCAETGTFTASVNGDCDDANKAIHPGATEICNDADDNCNGQIDEGCDDDVDLWCDATMTVVGTPAICPSGKQDCNDLAAGVHPGQPEICGNGIDDNCDGLTDTGDNLSGCVVFYADSDGDGYGDDTKSACLCAPTALYTTKLGGDCNDADASINPKAPEVCNGKDDNCDGITDGPVAVDCKVFYNDADGDGFGVTSDQKCLCAATGTYSATVGGDCNDNASAINPKAVEICNGIDDNCDGITDPANTQDCSPFFKDADGDNYGNYQTGSKCMCAAGNGYVAQGGDCDDNNPNVHPNATEICNGIDDNCDGIIDPLNSGGCVNYHLDMDGDTYGQTWAQCACGPSGFYTALNGDDCDDNNAAINPAATEICDGLDNNCNGQTDEGVQTLYYADADGDGYGVGNGNLQCKPTTAFSALLNGDCNDANKDVHPNAVEICNGIDDNCNGQTDEGAQPVSWYADSDGDGYGNASVSQISCTAPAKYVLDSTDCNDADASIHPGATEICNQKDDNCNGQTDEGLPIATYYVDADKDGYGTGTGQSGCGPTGNYTVTLNGDCNDADASIHPGATEVCNSKDDNCNGQTDEGLSCNACAAVSVNSINKSSDATRTNSGTPYTQDWWFDTYGEFTAVTGTQYQYYRWGDSSGIGYYNYTDDVITFPFTVPANANFIAMDVAFDNTHDTGIADTQLYMTLNFDGAIQQIGPFPTIQGKTWFSVLWPVSAAQQSKAKSIVAIVQSANSNLVTAGGIAIDNIRAISGCTDASSYCGSPNGGAASKTFYTDADGDGYGDPATGVTACFPAPGKVAVGGDCNDANAAIHPGAAEIPCNGIDDNCNGQTDEGNTVLNALDSSADYVSESLNWWAGRTYSFTQGTGSEWCGDSSGCGYPKLNDTVTFNVTIPNAVTAVALDVYFDNRHSVGPDTVDATAKMVITMNGVKRQVGPFSAIQTNKWRTVTWPVAASDYGKTYLVSSVMTTGSANTSNGGGCTGGSAGGFAMDNARAILSCTPQASWCTPGVTASNWFKDGDGDGFGDPNTSVSACIQPTGYIANGGDCNDANAAINPGVAKDLCSTPGVDDNCDGVTDGVGSTGCIAMYPDVDGDTYGSKTAASVCMCTGAPGYVTNKTDCNDANAAVNPGATEICNGIDDNCDGLTDPQNTQGCTTWFLDSDKDGFGVTASTQCWCSAQVTYSAIVGGDCNDANAAINPGATEICNSVDDNCNGQTDEGLPTGTWYKDADGDGYGNPASSVSNTCELPTYVTDSTDCNDASASIHPGAPEVCNNLDDNCNGQIDEGLLPQGTWYLDADKDGFGDATKPFTGCQLTGYVASPADCNDANAAINPGVAEVCGNNIDDNCNGQTDEGCPVCTGKLLQGFDSGTGWTLGSGTVDWWYDTYGEFTATEGTKYQYLRWGASSGCGYYGFTGEVVTWTVTIPTDAQYIAIDYAFDNSLDNSTNPITADTQLYMTMVMDGTSYKVGPFAAYQSAAWKTYKWPVSVAQRGKKVTMTATVQSANTNSGCAGGIAIDNVRSTCQ